jgi:hypothetical protein
VKSRAREKVLGYLDAPKSSGYAIFRAWLEGAKIRKDLLCAHLAKKGGDHKTVWIGPDSGCAFVITLSRRFDAVYDLR